MSHKMVVGFPLYWKRLLVLRRNGTVTALGPCWTYLVLQGLTTQERY
uniref:Uncharacterized protein n=1 Tax=Anguilla anguilla TaxID=7936 RepID=A0A0E9T6N4_ANGAN